MSSAPPEGAPPRPQQPIRFRQRNWLQPFIIAALLLALIVFAWHSITLLYDARYSVTRQDFWRIYLLDLRLPFPLNALHKHNNHPVLFPSLIWLTVLYWFGNNQTLLFFCGLALTLMTLALLLASFWGSPSLNLQDRLTFSLFYTVGTLWVGKANITASGGFSCMNSFASIGLVASLLFLHSAMIAPSFRARSWALTGAAGAALLASLSFGTGIAAWGACLVVVIMRRASWRWAAVFIGGGLVSAAIVLALPDSSGSAIDGSGQLFSILPALFWRFAQLLGAPWFFYGSGWIFPARDNPSIDTGVGIIGLLGLSVAGYFLLARWRNSRPWERAETVAFGMLLGMLGSLALIAVGRSASLNPNPHETLAPRYYFWSALFWSTLPAVAHYARPRLRQGRFAIALVAILFTSAALPSQSALAKIYATGRRITETAAFRVVCGVESENDLQDLFRGEHAQGAIYPLVARYRQLGLDMFAWPGARYVGGWMEQPECEMKTHPFGVLGHWRVVQVFSTAKRKRAAQVVGWSLTRKEHRLGQYVLIAQGNGRIVGLGRFTFPYPGKNEKYHLGPNRCTGFEGYIQDYSPERRYLCRVVVQGELAPQELPQSRVPFPVAAPAPASAGRAR